MQMGLHQQLTAQKTGWFYLLLAAFFLLFGMLGARDLWTHEHRAADIVSFMFLHHDFLHPVLNGSEYYDKPVLSYWLVAGLVAFLGKMTPWILRLPSALAGLLAIFAIYRLGTQLKDHALGLLSGWLLLTTFYFVFWARVSGTDMLNLGGILFALAWYFEKRATPTLLNYLIFFLIVAVSALCKGLVAPVVVFFGVVTDLFLQKTWKTYISDWRLYLACSLGLLLYLAPFLASLYFQKPDYHSNGLAIVYRENILRYLHPFDHEGGLFLYFIYLPIYLLPWTFLLPPMLFYFIGQRSRLLTWPAWVLVSLLVFFTLSGGKRGYYVLPMVPFVILMIADWILLTKGFSAKLKLALVLFYSVLFINYLILQPLYYAHGGVKAFAHVLKKELPMTTWHYSMLDAVTNVRFYLRLSPDVKNYGIVGLRDQQTVATLMQKWPTLKEIPPKTIFITRRIYEPVLRPYLKNFTLVRTPKTYMEIFFHQEDLDAPIAFIPIQR